MQKALRILIIVGIAVWGFLLLAQYGPGGVFGVSGDISDANYNARCAKYGADIEGERALDYRDRVQQFIDGCW